MKIKRQIVSTEIARRLTYAGENPRKYIIVHETDNNRKGANAQAHANLQSNGNSRQASWHYQVDDKQAIQSFEDSAKCWHAGNRRYNEQSIGIEICVNSDGNFKKAVDNTAELTRRLMEKYGISSENVIQHNDASGKNCPRYLRSGEKGINWSDFKAKLSGKKTDSKPSDSSSKKKSITEMAKEVIAGKHGSGHSNRRKSLGISSSEYKKVRAEVNKRVVGGSNKKPSKPAPKQKANLSVDGKWGKDTTRALQKALNTTVDGVISRQPRNSVTMALYGGTVSFGSGNGSPMVRALQRKIGAGVDGKLGPKTVRRLQRYLGTVQDGKLSRPSLVVKELQRRLNAGTF